MNTLCSVCRTSTPNELATGTCSTPRRSGRSRRSPTHYTLQRSIYITPRPQIGSSPDPPPIVSLAALAWSAAGSSHSPICDVSSESKQSDVACKADGPHPKKREKRGCRSGGTTWRSVCNRLQCSSSPPDTCRRSRNEKDRQTRAAAGTVRLSASTPCERSGRSRERSSEGERYQPRTCGIGGNGAVRNVSIQTIPLSSRNQNMSSDRRSRRFGGCYSLPHTERIPLRVEAAVAASDTANTRSGPFTLRT